MKILLVTDSAAIDTGFGRVAREIGTYLSSRHQVAQLGWFHMITDRVVPFRIFKTIDRTTDGYGQRSYDAVVKEFQPDVVLAIGDHWMLKHIVVRPRKHKLVGYIPIDGWPVSPEMIAIYKAMDRVVAYGDFGKDGIELMDKTLRVDTIPHGVDLDTFHPQGDPEKLAAKKMIMGNKYPGDINDAFLVGCVARNNTRKQLPRLIKTFAQFVAPWSSCQECSHTSHSNKSECSSCKSTDITNGEPKRNAFLYMHCNPSDVHGHDLVGLVNRFSLSSHVLMPKNMTVGRGVSDEKLAQIYNAFDLFTLPTGGEGWGLPIAEAMACGIPALITDYSGHLDFCTDKKTGDAFAETINVADWVTQPNANVEHALADLVDYEMKLDRFYYDSERWFDKWGMYIKDNFPDRPLDDVRHDLATLSYGKALRDDIGSRGHGRIQQYGWPDINARWDKLLADVVGDAHCQKSVHSFQCHVV